MKGPKSPLQITLTNEEKTYLQHLLRRTTIPNGLAQHARIVVRLAEGDSISETARLVGVQRRIVRQWGRRFRLRRIDGLRDTPRSGRPPVFSPRGSCACRKNGLPDAF